ncbi:MULTISPECIES: S8/S53 family peptidase [unclassified Bradyrhizobium]|uniref:S8 family peptidase n=1 Tax=unclassified Bradyrhizobium TaxID=2631580 RepID=UPI001BA595B4|nr:MULTISPECIES: S8/S53 family peptidase [unclassified Bradyrhizobium]MBR1207116.1 S8 family serine peptidase [Bradyrhizobium sp. AUGA SZCCT0124]MBR1313655.1 S8 family serine peptidase [Bradyrhizobium sp. AUGA SZCCT0051]MBR1343248.1 S8 family serine peptidase [Bradyrhizobium sp. AUGA SZCCT0105]MBR1357332.1 S8 family serine peptidase [Bradyrhizobium sp. AUGA SZCCT0045]
MKPWEMPTGYVRVLAQRNQHDTLVQAANDMLEGRSPAEQMRVYADANAKHDFVVDTEFGAVPIWDGADRRPAISVNDRGKKARSLLALDKSRKFLIRAYVAPASLAKSNFNDGEPVWSDPDLSGNYALPPANQATGDTHQVRQDLDTTTLQDNGLYGGGVAVAIVDTGICRPHLAKRLGFNPALDVGNSWTPPTLATTPGLNRIGHGTMCAYGVLAIAPNVTLLDYPLLLGRPAGEHTVSATIGEMMRGYLVLIWRWAIIGSISQSALVVNNSWGIFHPSLDEFPANDPRRYIDNPNHPFALYIWLLTAFGADVVFAAGNCGNGCPSAVCLQRTAGMIMGANAYTEVLTLAGCDIHDARVCYSSQGPSIAGMPPQKPDITAYTQFLGSKVLRGPRGFEPDTGTSTSCAIASGCIAALRTRQPPTATDPAAMIAVLQATALPAGGAVPNYDYGYGVVRPVAAGRSLGIIP